MGLVVHVNNRKFSSSYEVETKGDAQIRSDRTPSVAIDPVPAAMSVVRKFAKGLMFSEKSDSKNRTGRWCIRNCNGRGSG